MGKTIIRTPLMMQQGILPASRSLLCRLPTCGCMALLTPQHAHYRQSATLLCVDMFIRIHFIRMDTIFRTVLVVRPMLTLCMTSSQFIHDKPPDLSWDCLMHFSYLRLLTVCPLGQQQVVTQIIRGQPVSTAVSSASPVQTSAGQRMLGAAPSPRPVTPAPGQSPSPSTPQGGRPQQGQVKLTLAQLTQLTQGAQVRSHLLSFTPTFTHTLIFHTYSHILCVFLCLTVCVCVFQGGNQGLTVVIQGQGQTTGQLQVIPQGVTVIPGPGQQLMQAAMPNGQVQRFLFTPGATAPVPNPATTPSAAVTPVTATTTPSGPGMRPSHFNMHRTQGFAEL